VHVMPHPRFVFQRPTRGFFIVSFVACDIPLVINAINSEISDGASEEMPFVF
jgi:hypothetical protein